jgi:hypothetical protein
MTIKTKVPERYGCPICGFRNENEDAIIEHMLDMADNPDHLKLEELEQAYYSRTMWGGAQ